MSISTEDVNFLIWQYFKDSGFPHTAFVFGIESFADSTNIQQNQIPPNMLVTLLENAHKYMILERQVKNARNNENDPLHSIIEELEAAFPDPTPSKAAEVESILSPTEPTLLSPAVASILAGHHLEVYSSAWSPDGHYLATASADTTVMIWDLLSGTHKTIGKPTDDNDSGREITVLDWSVKNIIASGSFDSKVRLYSPEGATLATFAGHSHHVFSVKFNPAGTYLLSSSADHTIIVWDIEKQIQIICFNHHKDTILDIVWQDNSTFACASADNTASICDIQGACRILRGHSDHINSVSFSPLFPKPRTSTILNPSQISSNIASNSNINPNLILNTNTNMNPNINSNPNTNMNTNLNTNTNTNLNSNINSNINSNFKNTPNSTFQNPDGHITAPTQKLLTNPLDAPIQNTYISFLATGSDDKKVMIWEGNNEGYVLEGHSAPVSCVAFSPKDPQLLASVAEDGEVILWNVKTRTKLRNLGTQSDIIMSMAFSPDGKYLVTGGDDAKIEVTRISDGKIMAQFSGNSSVYDLKWDPLGEKIAASFGDSTVAIVSLMKYLI